MTFGKSVLIQGAVKKKITDRFFGTAYWTVREERIEDSISIRGSIVWCFGIERSVRMRELKDDSEPMAHVLARSKAAGS